MSRVCWVCTRVQKAIPCSCFALFLSLYTRGKVKLLRCGWFIDFLRETRMKAFLLGEEVSRGEKSGAQPESNGLA